MNRAIHDLTHEHDAIVFALDVLDGMQQRLSAGTPVAPEDLSAFLGFLREFADKCHHGKEEGMLFPALVAAGLPERGGDLEGLLQEHVEGRRHIAAMEAALRPTVDATAFGAAARAYADLLRRHIRRENEVLFPLAERTLSQAQLAQLFEAFEVHEAEVIGPGRHEELHALLKALKARYAA